MRVAFEGLVLDDAGFALRRGDDVVHIEPQVFEVLAYLVAHRERVVAKHELLDAVWGDRFVSESALTSRIKAARRAVGDDGTAQRVIRTVHGRGYRFVAPVEVVDDGPGAAGTSSGTAAPDRAPVVQTIRFCTAADGTRLAYAVSGQGPPLRRAAHWMTHVEYDLRSPVWGHWITDLSAEQTLVRYDERGCGLSDHDVAEFSLAAWVDDLAAVVDAAGLDRFTLLGLSQGGAVSIAYTEQHPERVERLVLCNAYAEGRSVRAQTDAQRREAELQSEMAAVGWGRDDLSYRRFFAASFMPTADPERWDAFAELQRRTTSAENAHRFLRAYAGIDVSDRSTRIRVPTLVVHALDDHRVPFDQARRLASLIPGSRLIPVESENHLFLPEEPAWAEVVRIIRDFVHGELE